MSVPSLGCSGKVDSGIAGGASDAAAGHDGAVQGIGEMPGTPELPDATGIVQPLLPDARSPDAESVCYVDFPCMGAKFACADARSYQLLQSMDCHFSCGPGPCSGGTCNAVGAPIDCPSGTACVPSTLYGEDLRATPCEVPDAAVALPDANEPDAQDFDATSADAGGH
jgi:hypothetical protein